MTVERALVVFMLVSPNVTGESNRARRILLLLSARDACIDADASWHPAARRLDRRNGNTICKSGHRFCRLRRPSSAQRELH
jgi:hypothetical protein